MSLALPEDGSITALDKNQETSEIAVNFFKKAAQDNKIKLIISPALESLNNLNDQKQKFEDKLAKEMMEWGQTNGGVEIKSNFTIQVLAAFGDF